MNASPIRQSSTALRTSARTLTRTAGPVLYLAQPSTPLSIRVSSPVPKHFSTSLPLSVKRKMPPKKKTDEVKKVMLGRPGNNLKVCLLACSYE